MREWLKSFLRGMGSISLFPAPLPSYEEQFGTDEELLEKDRQVINQDLQKALDKIMKEES